MVQSITKVGLGLESVLLLFGRINRRHGYQVLSITVTTAWQPGVVEWTIDGRGRVNARGGAEGYGVGYRKHYAD